MYQINTNQARTDLFAQGQGEAQVFELDQTKELLKDERKEAAENKRLAKKAGDDKEADVYKKITELGKTAIMPRDIPLFAQKKDEFVEYVKANINPLRAGDSSAWADFSKKYSDIVTEAEMSKNAREYAEQVLRSGALDKTYDTDAQNFTKWMTEGVGDYDTTSRQIPQRVDYFQDVVIKQLVPKVKELQTQTGRVITFTPEEAQKTIEDSINSNPAYAQAAIREFEKASDFELEQLGIDRDNNTAVDYFKAKYSPYLERMNKKPEPASSRGGGAGNANKVSADVTSYKKDQSGTEYLDIYVNGKEAQFMTVEDPDRQGTTIEIKPLRFKRYPDKSITVLASKKMPNGKGKIEEFDYDTARKLLFGKYSVDDMQGVFDNPSGVVGRGRKMEFEGGSPQQPKVGKYDPRKFDETLSKLKAKTMPTLNNKKIDSYSLSTKGNRILILYTDGSKEIIQKQ